MGSLLDLDLLYADLPDPPEPIFDIHIWNQDFAQMNDAPKLGVCRHASAQVIR